MKHVPYCRVPLSFNVPAILTKVSRGFPRPHHANSSAVTQHFLQSTKPSFAGIGPVLRMLLLLDGQMDMPKVKGFLDF
jgi:hypothetical protein